MDQFPIREYNNQRFSIQEGAKIIAELAARTNSDQEGYNSIDELATKVKAFGDVFVGYINIASEPTEKGLYVPTQDGVYPNAGGLEVTLSEGLTFFAYDGVGWGKIVSTVDLADYAKLTNEDLIKSGLAFNLVEIELNFKQYTTETTTANPSVSSVHGYSFPVGYKTKFDTIEVKIAQNISTPVTEIEVRFFKDDANGALLGKKRIAVSGTATLQIIEVEMDAPINYEGQIWSQFMTNNPMSLHKIIPAVEFSAANGYAAPRATLVNDLDGTIFATNQSNVDVYMKFNSIGNSITAKDDLNKIIRDGVILANDWFLKQEIVDYSSDLSIGYINSTGDFSTSINWRSTSFIKVEEGYELFYKGKTVFPGRAITYYDENQVYIETILGLSPDETIEQSFIVPENVSFVRFCCTVAGGEMYSFKINELFIEGSKIDMSMIAIPYLKITKTINETWNAIGHSIWAVDGGVYSGASPEVGQTVIGTQTLVREKIKFSGYNNYGYSGHSLAGLTIRDTSSILNKTGTWVSGKIWSYDSITNDHKRNIPLGAESDFLNNTGKLTYYGALRELHEVIKALYPNYIMFCSSPLQKVNGIYTSFSANTEGHTMNDYIAALQFVRNRLGWRYVDQFCDSTFNMDNILENTYDGLHPNNSGYAKYAGIWISEFFKI